MRLAIVEARGGWGRTSPNPVVGAVVVRGQHVVATAHHEQAGRPHAERLVVERAAGAAQGAELFVNLEPCCHEGRTEPCTRALIEAGIRRVVAGCIDPNPLVSGRGLTALEKAGIEVVCPMLEDDCRRLNAPFFKFIREGLPYVTAKFAMTLDGKIAAHTGDSRWISNEQSRQRAHQLRDEHDAVLVGANTLVTDDPALTTREIVGGRDPIRVVLDPRGQIRDNAKVLVQESAAPTWVVCDRGVADALSKRLPSLHDVIGLPTQADGRLPIKQLMQALANRDVMTLLVEGGGETLASFVRDHLVDRVVAFIAPRLVGGRHAPTPLGGEGAVSVAEGVRLIDVITERLGDDLMLTGTVDAATCAGGS